MNLSKIATICAHEYVTNVRRKEFILMTLGIPLMMLVFGGIGAGSAILAAGIATHRRAPIVAIVDPGNALDMAHIVDWAPPGVAIRAERDLPSAQRQVVGGKIEGVIVLDANYLQTGGVTVYRQAGGLLSKGDRIPIDDILTRGVLARAHVDAKTVKRSVEPTGRGATVLVADKHGVFAPRSVAKELAGFLVPYAFTILLTTAIFFAASYLLRGIADEKENRVIEVILSSVTADELLAGKLIGLGGVGLTQVGVWFALGAVPAMLRFGQYVHLSALSLVCVALFFTLGFLLYATMMAGLGALGTTYRESQQTASVVSFAAFAPFVMLPLLLEYPNGAIARTLSYIPFTAPATMVLRVTATDVAWWEIPLSALTILLTTWLILKLSAKLFRYGLLIYGKRPTLRQALRQLRQA